NVSVFQISLTGAPGMSTSCSYRLHISNLEPRTLMYEVEYWFRLQLEHTTPASNIYKNLGLFGAQQPHQIQDWHFVAKWPLTIEGKTTETTELGFNWPTPNVSNLVPGETPHVDYQDREISGFARLRLPALRQTGQGTLNFGSQSKTPVQVLLHAETIT